MKAWLLASEAAERVGAAGRFGVRRATSGLPPRKGVRTMRSSYAPGRASLLLKTPSHRQQTARRRLTIVCLVLGLALASGVVGSLIHPAGNVSSRPATGPFSYFPSQ